MDYYVYGLADPRDEKIMYVGITNDLYRRFMEHIIGRGKNAGKNVWVRKLQSEGIIPSLKLIETVKTSDEARMREAHWIQHYGVKLLNIRRPPVRSPHETKQRLFLPAKKKSVDAVSMSVDWIGSEDFASVLELNKAVTCDFDIPPWVVYQKWLKKNPRIALGVFDASNREKLWAYIVLTPLEENAILSTLKGDIEEKDVNIEDVETDDHQGSCSLLVNKVISHPKCPYAINRLLRRVLDEWVTRHPTQQVARLYAQATSESNFLMVQHLFMQPRYDLSDKAYMIDFSYPSASKIVRRFQEQLKTK